MSSVSVSSGSATNNNNNGETIWNRVQTCLEKYHSIHQDVWNVKANGLMTKGTPIVNTFEMITEETVNTVSLKDLALLETMLEKGLKKQKEREQQEQILNTKYGEYLSIISLPEFPAKGNYPRLDASQTALQKKLEEFTFDEENKVIGGVVTSVSVGKLNFDAIFNEWKRIQSKKRKDVEPETINVDQIVNTIKSALVQWQKDIQLATQEIKDSAQELQDMIATASEENISDIHKLFKELASHFKSTPAPSIVRKKTKVNNVVDDDGGVIGQCSRCKQNKKRLFGQTRACYTCYADEELDLRIKAIYAKERKYFELNPKKRNKYERTIKHNYATCYENFNKTSGVSYYPQLIKYMNAAEDLMRDVNIDDIDLNDINESFIDDDEEEEEEEEDDEEEEEDDEGDNSLFKNGLPMDYNSSEEFKVSSKKKKKKESNDSELIKEILQVSIVATEEDRKNLFSTFVEHPDNFLSLLKEVKEQRVEKYKFEIIIDAVTNKLLPEKLIRNNIYFSEEEAITEAKTYCDDTTFSFRIIKI